MTIRRLLNYWLSKKRHGFYVFWGLAAAAIYFVGVMVRPSGSEALSLLLERAGFLAFLGIVLAFFIHLNLHASHWFLKHFKEVDHLPRKQIMLVNSFCMTLFLSLALMTLPAAALCMESLWQAIGRWFSSRAAMDKAVYPAEYMASGSMDTPDLSALLEEARPTARWISLFDKLIGTAGGLIAILLIILAIRSVFCRIWAWITKPRHFDNDEKIYLTPVWFPSSSPKPQPHQKRKGFRLSYDEKIRQKYRRKILSLYAKKKQTPALSASPTELEHSAGLCHPTLHGLYEKARYSRDGCTKADWQALGRAEDS